MRSTLPVLPPAEELDIAGSGGVCGRRVLAAERGVFTASDTMGLMLLHEGVSGPRGSRIGIAEIEPRGFVSTRRRRRGNHEVQLQGSSGRRPGGGRRGS